MSSDPAGYYQYTQLMSSNDAYSHQQQQGDDGSRPPPTESGATKKTRNTRACESCRAAKRQCLPTTTGTCERCTHQRKTCTFSSKEHGNARKWPSTGGPIVDPPQSGPQVRNVELGTYGLVTNDDSQANPQGFAQNNPMPPPIDYSRYGSIHGGAGATGGGSVDPAMYMNDGDGSYAPMPGAGDVPSAEDDFALIMRMDPEYRGDGYQYRSYGGHSSSHAYQYLPPPE
ncbi:hypothetical protein B9479_006466 [Cryptococcus floricola]|uniref:Zn(2)-C6 fungal-type domain-containing protein n=1 Tax=Cryptococcus floricola TaxID=2591691 RepID=A0A5D3ARQ4_9TREE|nr:hypothetical protein B9479_006466 [Cryptococcus floricola]